MMQSDLHSTPHLRDVLREQVRAVGIALRVPAAVAAALVTLATLFITSQILQGIGVIRFHPEHQMLPSVMGVLFPIAVWRGEERFGTGFLWTLPVDRRQHALARVFSGWVWLMAAVALFVLWLLLLTLLSGESVLTEETLRLVAPAFPPDATLYPGDMQTIRWGPEPVLWLVPFTAATGTYLLASALALGSRYPLRWIAGTVLGLLLLSVAGEAIRSDWLASAPESVAELLHSGPYGLDALFTARTESFKIAVPLPTGERVVVWRGLPDLKEWATATLLWTVAGLVALWAAASRHRERRSR